MYYIGLDLGQASDYSALSIFEQIKEPGKENRYHCVQLFRFPLRTPYPEVVRIVAKIMAMPELGACPTLVVDSTGVGAPVVDLLRNAGLTPIPVLITFGATSTTTPRGEFHTPKVELISNFQILLQTGRVGFAKDLPDVQTLLAEMETFQVRVTKAANEVFGAFREGAHDDLVLASCLPLWYAEKIDGMSWVIPMTG